MYHGRLPEVRPGYTINEVPVGLRSDSVIVPDNLLRPTQTNIGHFLARYPTLAEDSYGIHKSEYSGTGGPKVSINGNDQYVARKIQHFRTGLHGSPEPPISNRCMASRIKHNAGLFAMDINKVGNQIFEMSHAARSEPLPKLAEKQLFPRSIVFELDYLKAISQKIMLEALEREIAILEEKLSAKTKSEKEKMTQEKLCEKDKTKICEEVTEKKDEEKHEVHGTCTSVCGLCGCSLTRGKCPKCYRTESKVFEVDTESISGWKGDACKKWPNKKPKYISSWGDERKAELLRVGYPFATGASDWLYCTIPPFDTSQFYRPSKKKFPERSFSSLLI